MKKPAVKLQDLPNDEVLRDDEARKIAGAGKRTLKPGALKPDLQSLDDTDGSETIQIAGSASGNDI